MNSLNEQKSVHCSSRAALAFMVNSEIGAVLTVMRRNVKWGVQYGDEDQFLEHPLIYSFKEIRKKIFSWQHQWHIIDPIVCIKPFLDVIQSDETGPQITGVALSSVHKILTLGILDLHTVNAVEALHQIVDAVTICRFEVTDSASEEVVLMKILQVLLACVKINASVYLSHYHVCNIVTTCFRIVHQASSKGERLQKIAHHTMNELIWCIFSRLPDIDENQHLLAQGSRSCADIEVCVPGETYALEDEQNVHSSESLKSKSKAPSSEVATVASSGKMEDEGKILTDPVEFGENGGSPVMDPYGVPCIIEVFQYLCSLLNSVEGLETGSRSNLIPNDEDVPLFTLGLINTAIELGGAAFGSHPKLLSLIQEELFYNLMKFGLSMSPQVLSTVCSIVLNLYHLLRDKLKLQLEAFFSGILLRVAGSKHGSSYQLREVAMEALVDLCRQDGFVTEMYANFDCDISCNNVFQDIVNLLSKSAFPVSSPLAAINTLALDGLLAMVQGMAERVGHESSALEQAADFELQAYEPFWRLRCENHNDPTSWVPFARKMNQIKRKLMVGVDHFNQDSRKGLEFLQAAHLLPEFRDPKSVACFLRFATGLDKNLIGDFLGGHDEFRIQVLREFVRTFDFQGVNLDTALRIFLETFRLPGEAQKIQRVLEAFSDRYYEQSPDNFNNRDATLLLSYSLILLNTDQHNAQVKKKMTEEDFIRNNRRINGGNDLPREVLSELYHAICKNEIKMVPENNAGVTLTTRRQWIGLVHKSKRSAPYIGCDTGPYLDYDMFSLLSGPIIAAISVIFDHVEQEYVLQACIDGFLSIAKISAAYDLIEVIDDLVVSLCKCMNLLLPLDSDEDFIQAFGDDTKGKMATNVLFTIANGYGDHIRSGWQNIVHCILSLNNLGILPSQIAIDAADQHTVRLLASSLSTVNVSSMTSSRKSSGFIGRFSQFLYLDAEGKAPRPSLEQLAARERTLHIIQDCHIDSIFAESKFLQDDSLAQLVQALLMAASQPDNEMSAVLCLELLITITLNNRDRIMLIWEGIYEQIVNIVESTVMPCALVEKAVFGLLRICQRLLPYKESLITDELLNSLQMILKLDARVADAYCEQITLEVMHLVRANVLQIRSLIGWSTIISLLSITARHPEASEAGFETLSFLMADGAHLSPGNYVLCVNAAKQFAGSRVGNVDRSIRALNLMSSSMDCLVRWFYQTKEAVEMEAAQEIAQEICEMWLRLIQGLREISIDPREEVRNEAILALQRCLTSTEVMHISGDLWLQCYDLVIFTLISDLLEIAQQHSRKDYSNMEDTLLLSLNFSFKVFLLSLQEVSKLASFSKLWLGMLICFERYMKVKVRGKRSERINELVPELLKNTLFVMKSNGILLLPDADDNNIWQLSWSKINDIAPHLLSEGFLIDGFEQLKKNQQTKAELTFIQEGTLLVPPGKTAAYR